MIRFWTKVMAAAFVALLPTQKAISGGSDDVRANCADDWPNNYQMQEFCIQQQQGAAATVSRYISQPLAGAEKDVMLQCANDWQLQRGYNWQMVLFCFEQQNAARKRLGK
ncbi:hypothetical protein [Mesorhizobium opportunistum]|uniref:Uncharacterized protein n=1 Tax=Mesorhizobium opportunistum (strain LMG 24607 / HAMBI 3007 / WSM2075) TaxID=536019 RepID=F7XZY6_MESOW|nr:hypothetical protein [Mesorhizobium opportunistum]AEH88200.1 hypothetical protein Mesop_3759 [Mesorhizobium opportunistum WSM2075]